MICMTTDEWKEISKIIEEKDFSKLATEIAVRTYDIHVSKQELDGFMSCVTDERYKKDKDLELGLSPNVTWHNEFRRCIIEHEGYAYEFEFPIPVHQVVVRKIK